MPEPVAGDMTPEIRERAAEVVGNRFSYCGLDHPVLRTLFDMGTERMVRDLAKDPQRLRREKKGEEGPLVRKADAGDSPLRPLELLIKEVKLPALPQVLMELLRVVNDPKSSAKDVTEVISMDTSLSSHLLRIVNSAYYSFPFPIDTVIRAVTLIGTREISTLALSSSFLNMFRKSSDAIDVEQFWKHSLGCATIARALALKSRKSSPDRHFVSGLLHDIGRLVLASNVPEVALRVQATARTEQSSMFQAEEKVLGFDHGAFGGSLASKWSFPSTLIKAIRNHHAPYLAPEFSEPATVHVADIIVKALGIGFSGQAQVPPLDGQTWERLGIPLEEVAALLTGLEPEMETMFGILLSGKRPGASRAR